VRFPEKVRRAAPIAGTAKNTPHDFLYTDLLMEAITSDPGFQYGFYDSNEEVRGGLARRANIWAVMGFSTEFFKREHWHTLGFTSLEDFQIGYDSLATVPTLDSVRLNN
jgi:homoserine O-acetyltransferase/O-succinyltransferase